MRKEPAWNIKHLPANDIRTVLHSQSHSDVDVFLHQIKDIICKPDLEAHLTMGCPKGCDGVHKRTLRQIGGNGNADASAQEVLRVPGSIECIVQIRQKAG
jgi:hypothetical protein